MAVSPIDTRAVLAPEIARRCATLTRARVLALLLGSAAQWRRPLARAFLADLRSMAAVLEFVDPQDNRADGTKKADATERAEAMDGADATEEADVGLATDEADVALALFCSAHADGLGGSNEDEWLVLLPRDRLPLSGSLLEPPTGASLFAVVGLEFGASKRNRTLGLQQTQPPSDEPTFMAPLSYSRASID